MNKWILSGGLAAFLAAGLPWTASYGAPYAPGDPSFSEQWAFKNCGGSRIGCWDNGCNQTDRLCNLLDTVCLIFFDHAAGLHIFICIVNMLCCVVVLDHLILYHAHTSLFHCHLCQWNAHLICCDRSCVENLINLLLSIGCKYLLCITHSGHLCFQCLYAIDDFRNCCHLFLCHVFILQRFLNGVYKLSLIILIFL